MAEDSIAVLVEHFRCVAFARPSDREPQQITLRTMEPGQQRVMVRLYLLRARARRLLATFDLRDLPSGDAKPKLILTAQRTGPRRMQARLSINGEIKAEQELRIPLDSRLVFAALLPAALLLLIGGGSRLLRPILRPGAPTPPARTESARGAPEASVRPAHPGRPAVVPPAADQTEPTGTLPEVPAPRSATVYFMPDSAVLTSETRKALEALYREISAELETGAELTRLRLHGHTALAGFPPGRQRLSRRRAENVYRQLLAFGLPIGREQLAELEIRGFGDAASLTREPDEQHRNRRVEVTVE